MKVKVRGIYATALTKLFLECGFSSAQPSWEIVRRFELEPNFDLPGAVVEDKEDKQGVVVTGDAQQALELIAAMGDRLFDMVTRPGEISGHDIEEVQVASDLACFDIEFPSLSKSALDRLRDEVVPTVRDHHKLKILAPNYVDSMEERIESFPERRGRIEQLLRSSLVLDYFQKGKEVKIDHVRPEGEIIPLSKGEVIDFDPENALITLKRQSKIFRAGAYDGLGIAKEEGDYAITEGREQDWVLKHVYYGKEGRPKGAFFNINTPLELYPGKIRYLDLHVDVVSWPDGRCQIVDKEKLEACVKRGYLSQWLADKAMGIAEELLQKLSEIRAGGFME
jgi:predicted RNA-binding protein associated with RNAse of E/G family